ncbi:MAG: DUF3078 domain-containing protein [Saprospiraceae bacterium]|nr:DUF3078 domain-containing protein [Saprospiraceae bacterium]
MKKSMFFFLFLFSNVLLFSQTEENRAAQEAERKKKMESATTLGDSEGWQYKSAIGLDLGQLVNINPYVGAGSNRLGLGGALGISAKLKKNLMNWKNDFMLNLSTQRIGSGTVSAGSDKKLPFEKALDILSISSNFGYQIKEASPWSYSADLFLITQFLGSHMDSATKKIYLSEVKEGSYNTTLLSKLFSPVNISFALGMKYQKDPKWYLFLSPAALKTIYIGDQNIANLGVHGTALKENSTTEYEKLWYGLGAVARAGYGGTFLKRLNYSSELILFSDYLDKPKNVDLSWFNSLGIEIFKGLNLQFRTDIFYDDNKLNLITDNSEPGGVKAFTGKRTNLIQQLLISYNRNF